MKRSKKSLFNSMLIGFLSASMVLITPAYALTIQTDKTINKDVDDGLRVVDSTVTINGNVSDEKAKEGNEAAKVGNSTDTINGDVNTNVSNRYGTLTVTGNVNAKVDDSENRGVNTYNGSTTIGKDVTVDTETEGVAVDVYTSDNYRDDISTSNVNIGGNISIKGSGSTIVEQDTGWDENDNENPDEISFYNPTGLRAGTAENANLNVNVAGDITASSKGVATGINIHTYHPEIAYAPASKATVKINVTSGSVSASGYKEIDEGIVGNLNDSDSTGIFIGNGEHVNSEVNIVVNGDLTSEQAISIKNSNDKTTDM